MNFPGEATPDDIAYVVRNMRASDAEKSVLLTPEAREKHLSGLLLIQKLAIKNYVFLDRQLRPAALLGAYLVAPRRAHLHRLATDAWADVAFAMLRFGLTIFVPCVLEPSVDFATVHVPPRRATARAILARLGFVDDGPLTIRGAEFLQMVWQNPRRIDSAALPLGLQSKSSLGGRDDG